MDYDSAVHSLAEQLVATGHTYWARLLIDRVEAGATGTEIVMGLRAALAEMLESDSELTEDLRNRARKLFDGLGKLMV